MSTVGTTVNHGITLGPGTYTSPLTITSTGYIDNTGAGDAIFGPNTQAWTVVNDGKVFSKYARGIDFRLGGLVTNNGTITGSTNGIYIGGAAGTVTNSGTISATNAGSGYGIVLKLGGTIDNAGGLIQTARYGIKVYGAAGTVTNSGTIAATNAGGIYLGAGGSVDNAAVGALIKGFFHGVLVYGAAGTVTNSGTIVATDGKGVALGHGGNVDNAAGGLIQGYHYGVYVYNTAATVTNAGTITGTTHDGVALKSGGDVSNNAGMIAGYRNGVYSGGGAAGTVTNAGVILGSHASAIFMGSGGAVENTLGTLQGYGGGILIRNAAGTVSNTGTIGVTGTYGHGGAGVYLDSGGAVSNTGGLIQGYYAGIDILGGIGVVINTGTIVNTGVGISVFQPLNAAVYLQNGGTVVNSGTIAGYNAYGGAAVTIYGTGNSLLALENGYKFIGSVRAIGTANTLELLGSSGNAVTVLFDNFTATDFSDVLFGPSGNATLDVSNTTGTLGVTISGFDQTSEIIDLTAIGTDGSISSQSATTITIAGSLGSVTLQLDGSDGTQFTTQSDGATGTEVIACYCRGTMIETPDGEVPVEMLKIGDLVVTLSGEARPVRWIGRRAYDGRFIAGNRQVLPIRVKAGALAENVPARDLHVSPGHALYIDGVLVQAEHLVNGATIVQAETVDLVEYVHIELDGHDVILADGAPAETYTDCDNRYMFANGGEYAAMYPDDDRATWDFCFRRLEWADPELTEIRAMLLWRAAALGYELASDPAMHLIADGQVIQPVEASDRVYRFAIPAGCGNVLLASHSSVPAEIDSDSRDTRRLGVPIQRIMLSDDDLTLDIRHKHTALNDGFHGAETGHRWTDGRGRIPRALLAPFAGEVTVEVHLAPSVLQYRVDAAAPASAAA